jgi:hypothetical protein
MRRGTYKHIAKGEEIKDKLKAKQESESNQQVICRQNERRATAPSKEELIA